MKLQIAFLAALSLEVGMAHAQNAAGVSSKEIVIGSIQDLSGPAANNGKHVRYGMMMRVEEANEAGGINGRKIKLLVEDSTYDPKKAVLAAQKLVNQDGIFAMLAHFGTAQNMAAMPVQFEKNVINFFPITSSSGMYEPLHPLKYSNQPTYFDQIRLAAPRLMKERNLKKACVLYQDDDFGLEVVRGAEAGLKTIDMALTEKTSYKRGATDFSSQIARMKAGGCELVVLGTIIRETVGAMSEAQKTGFAPLFVGSTAVYSDLIPKLGGKAMDGLYGTMTSEHPYLDASSAPVRTWANKYKARFNEDPIVMSVYGYNAVDAFLKVAAKAGTNLNTESFVKTMDAMTFPRDIFNSPEMTFTPTKHLGNRYSGLSQLQNGRWVVVSDYVAFAGLKTVQKDGKSVVESEFFKD